MDVFRAPLQIYKLFCYINKKKVIKFQTYFICFLKKKSKVIYLLLIFYMIMDG